MPRSGIAGWYRISIFGFLRNFHAGLHDSCTKLPVKSVFVGSSMPVSSLAFVFLMVAILTGVRRDLEVVLISIFLMPKDTEHSKNYVCVFCASENSLFSSFALTVSLTVFRSLVKRAGVTPALGRWRREGQEFKVSLSYTEFEANMIYMKSPLESTTASKHLDASSLPASFHSARRHCSVCWRDKVSIVLPSCEPYIPISTCQVTCSDTHNWHYCYELDLKPYP